jgi:hypothetical protein
MNCPQIYSNELCVKQTFSNFFSSEKSKESVEVWKNGSMEVPCSTLGVWRWALSVGPQALNLVIKKQNRLSLPWKSNGVVARVISFTVQSVKDSVCS